jgi:SARP family transcriptional regulator, regulator of embCAB operon
MKAVVGVLGSTTLLVEGSAVPLSARPRAVLTALAVTAPDAVAPPRLASALWHGEPPRSATNAIQVYVSSIRKGAHDAGWVGDFILHRDDGYLLDPTVEVDLEQLQVAAAEAQRLLDRRDPVGAEQLLAGRTDIDPARVLADLPAEFGPAVRHSGQALLERARMLRLRALVWSGRAGQALPTLLGLCDEYPERGDAVELAALAYYASSRPAEALDLLRRHGDHLRHDFGLDPGEWLSVLQGRILSNDPTLLPDIDVETSVACAHTPPDEPWDAVVCARAVGGLLADGATSEQMPACLQRAVTHLGEWPFVQELVAGVKEHLHGGPVPAQQERRGPTGS